MKKLVLAIALALPLAAQQIDCPPQNQELVRIPEIVAGADHKLRGTVIVSAAQVNMPFRQPVSAPTPTSTSQCFPQWVRVMRAGDALDPGAPKDGYPLPMPGPTLRARVGDLVQLTFLNQIDPNVFPYSIDRGDTVPGGGCDETSVYPANTAGPNSKQDQFPNCFHGSSTANIHFHGSHVNPNATGDNVFVEIRPTLRTQDQENKPLVTGSTVREPFNEFFAQCEQKLTPADPLRLWPSTWSDLPKSWTDEQEKLLKQYDSSPRVAKKLWPIDEQQIRKGGWPQYYIGAYPYCFRIPQYTQTSWPPTTQAEATSTHTHGAGAAEEDESQNPERPLMMGQSPGLHWYHAHKHGSTAINVANGMTGAFVIEGQYDDNLDAFYGKGWMRKQPVIVINQLGVSPNLERSGPGRQDKGPDFSVNGRLKPLITMRPGEVQMWRIVNTSGRAGVYFVGPPAGFQWMQLAQDGVQFADANYKASLNQPLLLASGNRADLLVMAPKTATAAPVPVLVQNEVDPTDLASAAQITLMSVTVAGDATSMQFIPTAPAMPPFLADIKDDEVTGTKTLTFASSSPGQGGQHSIDGKKFSGEVGEVVLLNNTEEWKIQNATYGPLISHPFHIHVNPFQVTEVFDPNATVTDPATNTQVPAYVIKPAALTAPDVQCLLDPADPSTWKPCKPQPKTNLIWWDVFPIPSGVKAGDVGIPGYFKMRSRFVDYSGFYVLHCHILAHEDRGMMTIVEVAPLQSPYSHH
ncbi:MAG: multicopper oxidase domain-containing protein [Thermoanaerobaculia bacterium]